MSIDLNSVVGHMFDALPPACCPCAAVDLVDARPVDLSRMHSDSAACLAWCADQSIGSRFWLLGA
eukprot:11603157-Alexandrium_andersonii.AAC.1